MPRLEIARDQILDFLSGGSLVGSLNGTNAMKFLNLARSWVTILFPHVISKIDRVSYGVLNASDLAATDPKAPQSRN